MLFRMKLAIASVVALSLGVASCGSDAPNEQSAPEFAFRSFRAALAQQNHEAVWTFLGPESRDELQSRADEFAANGIGVAHPAELLLSGWIVSEADIESVSRDAFTDEHAILRIVTVFEDEFVVEMSRDGAAWRIELPLSPIEDDT